MRLSYSKYRTYVECPRHYNWLEINKKPSVQQSMYHALYGITIQRFFENYVNKYVKRGIKLSKSQIRKFMWEDWTRILEDKYVVWDDPWCKEGSDEIFESAFEDAIANIEAMDFFEHTRSEVIYNINLKKSKDELNGRMDFIVSRPDGTVEILDGKGTKNPKKYVDVEQLYFYALLYLLRKRKLPDKLGFWYYRFQRIEYIEFDIDTILEFRKKVALVKKSIKTDKVWAPKVKITKACKFCEYTQDCDAYLMRKEANRLKRGKGAPITHTGEILSFGF